MPVSLMQPSLVDLREPPQPLDLEQLDRPMKLGEVFFYARIGKLRQLFSAKGASEFYHMFEHMFAS